MDESNEGSDASMTKEEIDEGELQKQVDVAFLDACYEGSLDDVKRTLKAGASINAQDDDDHGSSALILACLREHFEEKEDTLSIVKFLLQKRCSPSMMNSKGQNAVHIAARYASAEVMQLLLAKNRHLARSNDNKHWTPLALVCSERFDDEGVRIAEVLLDAGADVDQGDFDLTPLLRACLRSQSELVALLLRRGANVHAVDEYGLSCLHLACLNGAFGKDIIPLLVQAGADVGAETLNGVDALSYALQTGYDMAETLLQHLPQGRKPRGPTNYRTSNRDPIGNISIQAKLGRAPPIFADFVNVDDESNISWACLRNGSQYLSRSSKDIFNVLLESCSTNLWILASREPCFQQHPQTGDTVLHLLCRTDKLSSEQKMEVLAALKKDFRNPLIPNFHNKRAIDLTSDPALKAELAKFMEWQPNRWVMHWYGPLFRKRAFALLLVLKRYPRAYIKDIRHLLLRYLARIERIYVFPQNCHGWLVDDFWK